MTQCLAAYDAFSNSGSATRTPRDTEYEAISRITGRIQTSAQKGALSFAELAAALHQNQQLWSTFAAEVADSNNALPDQMRAQIFYLAQFVRQQTSKVFSHNEDVGPLVDINLAVMRGLKGKAE